MWVLSEAQRQCRHGGGGGGALLRMKPGRGQVREGLSLALRRSVIGCRNGPPFLSLLLKGGQWLLQGGALHRLRKPGRLRPWTPQDTCYVRPLHQDPSHRHNPGRQLKGGDTETWEEQADPQEKMNQTRRRHVIHQGAEFKTPVLRALREFRRR